MTARKEARPLTARLQDKGKGAGWENQALFDAKVIVFLCACFGEMRVVTAKIRCPGDQRQEDLGQVDLQAESDDTGLPPRGDEDFTGKEWGRIWQHTQQHTQDVAAPLAQVKADYCRCARRWVPCRLMPDPFTWTSHLLLSAWQPHHECSAVIQSICSKYLRRRISSHSLLP